jgi:DNA-directed RNA polymerase specialized sigma24 family protein
MLADGKRGMSENDQPHDGQRQATNGFRPGVDPDVLLTVVTQQRQIRERPTELLGGLQAYVGYELGRRTRTGQLDLDDLHRDEVIDSAFAAALARLDEGQPIRDLPGFLRGRAQDLIAREVRRVQQDRRRFVSLEQTIASGDESEGGEEVRVGDVIPDPASRGPEQIAIDNETLSFLITVLSDVPDLWRTVFLQRTMQERTAREVAEFEGLDIDEVRRITVLTRNYLRERMEEEYEYYEIDNLFQN